MKELSFYSAGSGGKSGVPSASVAALKGSVLLNLGSPNVMTAEAYEQTAADGAGGAGAGAGGDEYVERGSDEFWQYRQQWLREQRRLANMVIAHDDLPVS